VGGDFSIKKTSKIPPFFLGPRGKSRSRHGKDRISEREREDGRKREDEGSVV